MKRAIILVIDSMGIGAMEDCKEYADIPECNTICNIAKANNGLNLPNMQKMGLGNLADIKGVEPTTTPVAQVGIMKELSKGKDTTTGHWELMGLVLNEPFYTFPNGFPKELNDKFIAETGCRGILGNCAASGTAIIEDFHEKHSKTKFPIIYTSADSVFQIAVDINIIPLETLYKWCKIARTILDDGHNVSRVIARPYEIIDGKPTRVSKDRRDYSVPPTKPTLLNEVCDNNGIVVGIGKIEDIFVGSGVTHAIHTATNAQGIEVTLDAITNKLDLKDIEIANVPKNADKAIIFTNLVDTDMLFGHRNDYKGYAKALEEIDERLPEIISALKDNDLLIITADHGCDPCVSGTDHTREKVPVIIYHKNIKPCKLAEKDSFTYVSSIVRDWLNT